MSIKIKNVVWRDGRPRFEPGPALRKQGHKGKDLRHDDGRWFTAGEALDWSQAFKATRETSAFEARQGAAAQPVRTIIVDKPRNTYSVGQLFHDYLKSPVVLDLRPATKIDYRKKSRVLESHDPDLWAAEVASLDQSICYGLYEDLWETRGAATARGALTILGMAIKWGLKKGLVRGLVANPATDLGMKASPPRARFLTKEEFNLLVQTADREGKLDIGDMIYCGVWTGQRQTDRLVMKTSIVRNGRFVLQQSKTGAIVNPPIAAAYQERLDAAEKRRKIMRVESKFLHLNEATWAPWNEFTYRNAFADIRTKAAKKLPSVATAMEKDMRATAVTWMALAGNTLPQICAVSGHSLKGAHDILKHYLALHPDMADTAIGNMVEWFDNGASTDKAVD